MTEPEDKALKPAEAAAIVGTTVKNLDNWIERGWYPALTKLVEEGGARIKRGRSNLYRKSLVEAFAFSSQTIDGRAS